MIGQLLNGLGGLFNGPDAVEADMRAFAQLQSVKAQYQLALQQVYTPTWVSTDAPMARLYSHADRGGDAPVMPSVCSYCGGQFIAGKIQCGCGANRPK